MRNDDDHLKIAVEKYFQAVNVEFSRGNTESAYNNPIIELFKSFGCNPVDISTQRKEEVGGNIDILLWHENEEINDIEPFGAIEVKKVDGIDERAKKNLPIEIKRYGNVILTDNYEWRFYKDSNEQMVSGFKLEKDKIKDKIDLFIQTIKDFVLSTPTNIKSASKLAEYMAHYAQTIREIVRGILQGGSSKPMYNELFALYSKLKTDLIQDLTQNAFANMYAQTIVYGLFIARYNDKTLNNFNRGEAIVNLSKESHLLQQFFQHIAMPKHPTLNDAIEKLCKLFAITDINTLLNKDEQKDTIVHFYEEFLSYYDKAERKAFGAFYTPVEVVRYMVRNVDKFLTDEFDIKGGLSNNETTEIEVDCTSYCVGTGKNRKEFTKKKITVPQVAILDPACGTGTFHAEIIKFIKQKYFSGVKETFYRDWLQKKNGLLSRLIAFEIMMTSYVVARLKIRRTITETMGDNPNEDLPTNIFLTNTLTKPKSILEDGGELNLFQFLDFSGAITEEAKNADTWKIRRPIKVIIGNPPYLASSIQQYDISAYKFETDGRTKLNERNPKWLNDDYVKFIRFAEQHIEKDGKGILAFISNNGYLDNPTFRGMRGSLLRTFDKIYILNLHGNSNKKETCPDGSPDENVFDIKVGVAIILAIKTTQNKDWAKVYYAEIYGRRENKFDNLNCENFTFEEIEIDKRTANFIPTKTAGKNDYDSGVSIVELFSIFTSGIMSCQDELCLKNTKQKRLKEIFNTEFLQLTKIGNDKLIIRHTETDKIEINNENYYPYFFNRCLVLIDLALKSLYGKGIKCQ